MDWKTVASEFAWDGSLRDMYVFATSLAEWDQFLEALQVWGYATRFSIDGEPAVLPQTATDAFEILQRAMPLLQIDLGGITLCCHFFTDEELELDLDPLEIDSPQKLALLTEFMRQLGRTLQRPVVVTPENSPEISILCYEPNTDRTSYRPPN